MASGSRSRPRPPCIRRLRPLPFVTTSWVRTPPTPRTSRSTGPACRRSSSRSAATCSSSTRGRSSASTPTTCPIGREELAGLEPEAILLGHGHFDHAADAGYVAGRTGAVVVGSDEICDTAKEDAARDGNADKFTCLLTGTADDARARRGCSR